MDRNTNPNVEELESEIKRGLQQFLLANVQVGNMLREARAHGDFSRMTRKCGISELYGELQIQAACRADELARRCKTLDAVLDQLTEEGFRNRLLEFQLIQLENTDAA